MAHKNKKYYRPQIRNADSTKPKNIPKKKNRPTYAEIATAKIEEKVNLTNLNKESLKSYKIEKNDGEKTFWDTLQCLEFKYKILDKTFNSVKCVEKLGEVKNCRRFYMEHLQTMFQAYIFQMMSKIEHAEILEQSGRIEAAHNCYRYDVIQHIDFKIRAHFQEFVDVDNHYDMRFKKLTPLLLIACYGLIRTKKTLYTLHTLSHLRQCLERFELEPELEDEKIELFHRTVHLSDLRLKILDLKCRVENGIATKVFRFQENSRMISALARKAFS